LAGFSGTVTVQLPKDVTGREAHAFMPSTNSTKVSVGGPFKVMPSSTFAKVDVALAPGKEDRDRFS
jgi:hypothetical protein